MECSKVVNSGETDVPMKVDFDVAHKGVDGTIIVSIVSPVSQTSEYLTGYRLPLM